MTTTTTPRLVATDLDGTLVRDDRSLSERTRAALLAVEDAGGTVVFVTGRPVRWMAEVSEAVGHHGLAICANGAVVYDLRRDEIVETRTMAPDIALQVVRRLREAHPEVAFAVETVDSFAHEPGYPARENSSTPRHRVAPVEELVTAPLLKLLARLPDSGPDAFLAKAKTLVGGLVEVTHASRVALLEMSAQGVSKATTLAWFCEQRGITADEVVAFGDMPNDLPMLAWAGQPYAVANAHPEVLAAVAAHTGSNEEDGVAQILEKLFNAPV